MEKLRDCPFCGGDGRYTNNYDTSTDGGEYIICDKCLTSTALVYGIKEDPKPLLAERWNTRTTDPLLEEMAEALENCFVMMRQDGWGNHEDSVCFLLYKQAEKVLQKWEATCQQEKK